MTRVYLAGRYSRREELVAAGQDLQRINSRIRIMSRWLLGNHQIDDQGLSLEATAQERTRFAEEDWSDLMAADWCISFTESPRSFNSRGGRHVEFGAAMALGKRCLVVGPTENVFHCLGPVERFESWDAFLEALKAEEVAA